MTDDCELYAQLKDPKRQRAAFGLIVRQYSEQLYWQIRRLVLVHEDADDVPYCHQRKSRLPAP